MQPRFRLWIVDDSRLNLSQIEASLPSTVNSVLERRSFIDARGFLTTFDQTRAQTPALLPDFVLIDFFLGRTYGSNLVDHMCAAYAAEGLPRAVIIGYSSMPQANAVLMRHGADTSLLKVKGQPTASVITQTFGSLAALEWLKAHRSPLPVEDFVAA